MDLKKISGSQIFILYLLAIPGSNLLYGFLDEIMHLTEDEMVFISLTITFGLVVIFHISWKNARKTELKDETLDKEAVLYSAKSLEYLKLILKGFEKRIASNWSNFPKNLDTKQEDDLFIIFGTLSAIVASRVFADASNKINTSEYTNFIHTFLDLYFSELVKARNRLVALSEAQNRNFIERMKMIYSEYVEYMALSPTLDHVNLLLALKTNELLDKTLGENLNKDSVILEFTAMLEVVFEKLVHHGSVSEKELRDLFNKKENGKKSDEEKREEWG